MVDLRELAKIWVGKSKRRQDDFLLGAQWAMMTLENKIYETPLIILEPIVAMKNLRMTEKMTKAMMELAKLHQKPIQSCKESAKDV